MLDALPLTGTVRTKLAGFIVSLSDAILSLTITLPPIITFAFVSNTATPSSFTLLSLIVKSLNSTFPTMFIIGLSVSLSLTVSFSNNILPFASTLIKVSKVLVLPITDTLDTLLLFPVLFFMYNSDALAPLLPPSTYTFTSEVTSESSA